MASTINNTDGLNSASGYTQDSQNLPTTAVPLQIFPTAVLSVETFTPNGSPPIQTSQFQPNFSVTPTAGINPISSAGEDYSRYAIGVAPPSAVPNLGISSSLYNYSNFNPESFSYNNFSGLPLSYPTSAYLLSADPLQLQLLQHVTSGYQTDSHLSSYTQPNLTLQYVPIASNPAEAPLQNTQNLQGEHNAALLNDSARKQNIFSFGGVAKGAFAPSGFPPAASLQGPSADPNSIQSGSLSGSDNLQSAVASQSGSSAVGGLQPLPSPQYLSAPSFSASQFANASPSGRVSLLP